MTEKFGHTLMAGGCIGGVQGARLALVAILARDTIVYCMCSHLLALDREAESCYSIEVDLERSH